MLGVGAVIVCILFTAALPNFARGQGPPCVGNDTTCLKALRDYLTRTDWWFGDKYSIACPDVKGNKIFACMNSDREHKTIISRVFQKSDYDVNNITQVLRVRFNVAPGSYQACGHRFNVPGVHMNEDLDFSKVTGLDSWTTRNRPAITWDPEPGGMYTLMAYNVDQLLLAGLWVNINGGDSVLGYELYPYTGPLSPLNRTSFHAFILFKQREVISGWQFDRIRDSIREEMRNSSGIYRLNSLLDLLHQISHAMGVGLISIEPDPYAIEKYKSMSLYNNCPWLIPRMAQQLKTIVEIHNLTALGADVSNLEVEVNVRYTSDAVQYTPCRMNLSENARVLEIDPLSQSPINPVCLRSPPVVSLAAVNMLNTTFFFDKLFTVLLLDVTRAITSPGPRNTSLLWHVTDIQGQRVTSGVTQKEYLMPLPLDSSNRLYIFFVFRQNDSIGNYSMDNYCSTSSTNDCDFNLYKFVQDKMLHLSGINWFWSQPDLYLRMVTCVKGMAHNSSRETFLLWDKVCTLCDTETDGGGWIVIQRRTKGDVDFNRDWEEYKNGFGTPDTDFWIGNEILHILTLYGYTELRVDLEYNETQYFAHYSHFDVAVEASLYRLSVSGYNGTAEDSLSYNNGANFSTFDQDNDGDSINCASGFYGAWWYSNCGYSTLNGLWGAGVVWNRFVWRGNVSASEMKVRHV